MTLSSTIGAGPPPRIGAWQLQRELGRGGMGRIFEVVHVGSGQRAALKLIESSDSPEQLERFDLEARIMIGLRHPALLRVMEILHVDGRPALVLELMAGSLRDRLRREGPLSWREALAMMAAIADGLEHAHSRGILHRDIKLGNILLAADGTPRLADFGLARMAADERSLTETGVTLGTPHTMSPEQIETPRLIDVRSDIYALGVSLYELLSGRRPVEGRAVIEIFQHVLRGELTPLDEVVPELPPEVCELVMGCLALRREQRPESAARFAEACRAILAGDEPALPESGASSDVPRGAGWLGRTAMATLGLVLVVTVLVLGLRERRYAGRIAQLKGRAARDRSELQAARRELAKSRDERERQARARDSEANEFESVKRRMSAELAELREVSGRVSKLDRKLREISQIARDRRLDQEALALARLGEEALGRDETALARRHLFSGLARIGSQRGEARQALLDLRSSIALLDPTRLVVPEQLPGPVELLRFSRDNRSLLAANARRMILWDTVSGQVRMDRSPGLVGPLVDGRIGAEPIQVLLQGQLSLLKVAVEGPGRLSDLKFSYVGFSLPGDELLVWGRSAAKLARLSFQDGRSLAEFGLRGRLERAFPTRDGWLLDVFRDDSRVLLECHREAPFLRPRSLPEDFSPSHLVAVSEDARALVLRRGGVMVLALGDDSSPLGPAPETTAQAVFSADGGRVAVRLRAGLEIHELPKDGGTRPRLVRRLPAGETLSSFALDTTGATVALGMTDGSVSVHGGEGLTLQARLLGLPVDPGDARVDAVWFNGRSVIAENGRGLWINVNPDGRVALRGAPPDGADPADRTAKVHGLDGRSWLRLTRRGRIELGGNLLRETRPGRIGATTDVLVTSRGDLFAELHDDGAVDFESAAPKPKTQRMVPADTANPVVFFTFFKGDLAVGRRDGTLSRIAADRSSSALYEPDPKRRGRVSFIACRGEEAGVSRAILVADRDQPGLTVVEATTRRLQPLHRAPVVAGAVTSSTSPKALVTVDASGELISRNFETGEPLVRRQFGAGVREITVSPDGERLLLVGREIRVIDLGALNQLPTRHLGIEPRRLSLVRGRAATLGQRAFSLAVPGAGRLTVPLARTGAVVTATDRGDRWVQAQPPDEQGRIRVELRTAGPTGPVVASALVAAKAPPGAIAATDGGHVAVAAGAQVLRLRLDKGALVSTGVVLRKAPVTALAAAQTGDQLLFADSLGQVFLLPADGPPRLVTRSGAPVEALTRHSPEHELYLGTAEGDVLVLRGSRLVPVSSLARPISRLLRLEELDMVAVATREQLHVLRTNPTKHLLSIRLEHPVVDLARSEDGHVLALVDASGTLRLLPLERLIALAPKRLPSAAAALRPDKQ